MLNLAAYYYRFALRGTLTTFCALPLASACRKGHISLCALFHVFYCRRIANLCRLHRKRKFAMALKALAPLHTTQMRVCSTPADSSWPPAPVLAPTHCCVMATSVAAASVDAGHCILARAPWGEAWGSCQRGGTRV